MTRAEQAKEYFKQGYTCSQAVVMAFSDLTGLNKEISAKVSISFGGGTGRLRLTCGALNGAFIVAGLLWGSADGNTQKKNDHYALVQKMAALFAEKEGSINCGELLKGKGIQTNTFHVSDERTAEYYQKRPCPDYIADAVEIVELLLEDEKKK